MINLSEDNQPLRPLEEGEKEPEENKSLSPMRQQILQWHSELHEASALIAAGQIDKGQSILGKIDQEMHDAGNEGGEKKELPAEGCTHNRIISKMGYNKAHEEAERRINEGQEQKRCPVCKLYLFEDEFGEGWPTDLVIVNPPAVIYLHPNENGLEDISGEVDFNSLDHEYTLWGESECCNLDFKYVLASSLSHKEDTEAVEFAEWIKDNFKRIYPIKPTQAIWFPLPNKLKIPRKRYTTTELYKLFKDGRGNDIQVRD